jgi:hypothetical protein
MHLYGPKQLADSIRTVRKNTTLIAEDIPEEHYGDRPTPDSLSVARILVTSPFFHALIGFSTNKSTSPHSRGSTSESSKKVKQRKGRRSQNGSSLNGCGNPAKSGRNGSKVFPRKSWPNRCASWAEGQKPALR